MNGLTVAKKIVLSFAILIVMFLGFGVYANHSGSTLNESTSDLMDWTRALDMSSKLSDAANDTRVFALLKASATDPQTRAKLEQQHAESIRKVEDVFAAYKKTLDETRYNSEEERKEDWDTFNDEYNAWQEYLKAGEEGDRLFAEGKREEALAFVDQKWSKSYQKLADLILADEERSINGADAIDKEADIIYGRVVMTTVIVTILVLVVAVVCGYFLLHSIRGSVTMMLDSLQKIAAGDLSLKLATDSADEFGQMADACNKMLHNVRSMTRKIQDTANSVSDSSGALTSTSEQSAQATQNVAESITEVAGAAQAQLDSVAEAKHQVHAFTRGLADATQTIDQVAADIEHTSQRAEEGNKLVLSVQAMEAGREEAERGRENVTATGKGFSEIRSMIQRVQENSAAIEKNMQDLSRRAEKIDDATGKIHDSASKVAAEAENVSAATEEQAAGMEEIAASTRGLSDMAHDLNAAAAKFKT